MGRKPAPLSGASKYGHCTAAGGAPLQIVPHTREVRDQQATRAHTGAGVRGCVRVCMGVCVLRSAGVWLSCGMSPARFLAEWGPWGVGGSAMPPMDARNGLWPCYCPVLCPCCPCPPDCASPAPNRPWPTCTTAKPNLPGTQAKRSASGVPSKSWPVKDITAGVPPFGVVYLSVLDGLDGTLCCAAVSPGLPQLAVWEVQIRRHSSPHRQLQSGQMNCSEEQRRLRPGHTIGWTLSGVRGGVRAQRGPEQDAVQWHAAAKQPGTNGSRRLTGQRMRTTRLKQCFSLNAADPNHSSPLRSVRNEAKGTVARLIGHTVGTLLTISGHQCHWLTSVAVPECLLRHSGRMPHLHQGRYWTR